MKVTDFAGKKVLVLSDNNGLSRVIEVTLTPQMEVMRLVLSPLLLQGGQIENDDFDLIVVAMSSPRSEPMVALSKILLTERTRHVPILIISDAPSHSNSDKQAVHHLDFPFAIDAFCDKVKEILREEPLTDLDKRPTFAPESTTAMRRAKVPSTAALERGYSRKVGPVDSGRQAEYWVG